MLKKRIKRAIRSVIPSRTPAVPAFDDRTGISKEDLAIVDQVRPNTITSVARVQALVEAVRYCVRNGIPGAFGECGVWRGGSVMAIILALQKEGVTDRDIWLYDTFEGMTKPTEHDVSPYHEPALRAWQAAEGTGKRVYDFFFASEIFNEDLVRTYLLSTGYPESRLRFVKGPVEQTVPAQMPEQFALLRLDTDWYESTLHELQHMYPRLATGGILIIDDYGHWEGCRRAVDEYFSSGAATPVLLNRIDYNGRLAVKR